MTNPVRNRSVARDLTTVLSGTAGAQAIGLLILPLLTRLFAPEAFGTFQLYLSLLIFSTIGVALRIEIALLSMPDDEADEAVGRLLTLVPLVSIATGLAVWAYDLFVAPVGFPVVLFCLGLLGNGVIQVTSFRMVRDQRFHNLASLKFSQVAIYAVLAIGIGVFDPSPSGLILADAVGRLGAAVMALFAIKKLIHRSTLGQSFSRLPSFIRHNWELVALSLPGALANSGGAMIAPFAIYHIFGASGAGQFSLVDRSLGVPISMVIAAGSQVFSGRLNELLRRGDIRAARNIYFRLILFAAALSAVGATIAYSFLPPVFAWLFGKQWLVAGAIARIMIFSYAIVFVSGLVNQTLISLRVFRFQTFWDFCWPVTLGAAWYLVFDMQLCLLDAMTVHAAALGALGLMFLVLCAHAFRRRIATMEQVGA